MQEKLKNYDFTPSIFEQLLMAIKVGASIKAENIINRIIIDELSNTDAKNKTVLHWAVVKSDERIVRLLLIKKPDLIDIVDKDGFTILHMAAANGHE